MLLCNEKVSLLYLSLFQGNRFLSMSTLNKKHENSGRVINLWRETVIAFVAKPVLPRNTQKGAIMLNRNEFCMKRNSFFPGDFDLN